ncbi:hypothetical protein [Bacillus sinesaloumensis]|uniref:hypothetical protein n=1 Tax=Litchfieldia sinesaloumensis TaxID=1926280 RepID=UPI000988954D|nr:hypothetical protein [Bacillus sinesaloumensis]
MNEQLDQFLHSVDEALKAVIESQGNVDQERFQRAQNMMLHAKYLLQEVEKTDFVEDKEFVRAKERLRNLEETHHAIEATIKF